MSIFVRTASVFKSSAGITLKTLKYGRTTLNYSSVGGPFGVGKVVKLDSYLSRREIAQEKLKTAREEMRLRIINSLDTLNAINSRDVQELIYTADKEDIELIIAALKKLELQSKSMRFSNFNLDAVVMRMFSFMKLPEEAYKTFLDDDLRKLFTGYNCVMVLLDLLYSNEMYEYILNSVDCLERRQNWNVWSARSVGVFYMAACLKLHTKETFQKGLCHYDKILNYREPVFELTLLAIILALKGNPQKIEHYVRLLGKNSRFKYIKENVMIQQLLSAGKLTDVEEFLRNNECCLAKDTLDLFVALSKNKSDFDVDDIVKKCQVGVSLEDMVFQENCWERDNRSHRNYRNENKM